MANRGHTRWYDNFEGGVSGVGVGTGKWSCVRWVWVRSLSLNSVVWRRSDSESELPERLGHRTKTQRNRTQHKSSHCQRPDSSTAPYYIYTSHTTEQATRKPSRHKARFGSAIPGPHDRTKREHQSTSSHYPTCPLLHPNLHSVPPLPLLLFHFFHLPQNNFFRQIFLPIKDV